jgi:hypothetical protein
MDTVDNVTYCVGTGGRYANGRCRKSSVFVVGLTGIGAEKWRGACRHHLAQIVSNQIEEWSTNGQIVVAELAKVPKGD